MATPMLQATRRCGSRVEFSAMTAKTTSPSSRYLRPSLRGIILHCGGKIEETRTRFRSDEAVRLSRGVLRDDRENNFAVIQILEAFFARNHFALRRKD